MIGSVTGGSSHAASGCEVPSGDGWIVNGGTKVDAAVGDKQFKVIGIVP